MTLNIYDPADTMAALVARSHTRGPYEPHPTPRLEYPGGRDFLRGQREDELSTPGIVKRFGLLVLLLTGSLAIGAGMIWLLVLAGWPT